MPWSSWIRTAEVQPSLYAADFARLGEQVEVLLRAGARVFHFDVGDGHFVPPITIGWVVLEAIAPLVHEGGGVLDVHLMTEHPERHLAAVAQAGGDSVTVHLEACADVPAAARAAREQELQVGLACRPSTAVEEAAAAAAGFDLVNVMGVEPGWSGQAFLPQTTGRVARLRELLPPEVHVQVDGGVGDANIGGLRAAGADLFVAGSSIFGREDLTRAYRRLVHALQ